MAPRPAADWALILLIAGGLSSCAAGKVSRARTHNGISIVKSAHSQLGGKYTFGGTSPAAGFDCSGLAWWTHQVNGIDIPRNSFEQYQSGRRISKKDLSSGDLVFFTTVKRGASHVGIYTGNGAFIHAPKSGFHLRTDRMSNPYWKSRYVGARRYY